MKVLPLHVIAALLLAAAPAARAAEPPLPADHVVGDKGCRPGESWKLTPEIPQDFAEQFNQFLGKKVPTARGFAEAIALRRTAATPTQKYFAEYWASRALYGSKLVHAAKDGLAVLASRPVSISTVGIQLAALDCLVEIHGRLPAIELPKSVVQRIPDYLVSAMRISRPEPIWDFVAHFAISEISNQPKIGQAESDRILSWLSGSGSRESLVRGMLAAQHSDHSTVIEKLHDFLADTSRSPTLARFVDTAEILTARSLYSLGRYEDAITHFKAVSRSSNELANSLQELSWAYLMAEKYREAIGTAVTLQAGGLRNTFAPEAPMVMAMSMNEICQYPGSVNAANIFRKNYEKSFKWLDQWRSSGESANLYKLAIQYLKRQGDTPVRVASEWVRSPLFLSDQDEINLLFDETESAAKLTQWGSHEQNRLAQEILDNLIDLKPRYYEAKAKLKGEQELPSTIRKDLDRLRSDVISFRRMQRAAPIWKAVLTNQQRQAPAIEKRLTAEITWDLRARSERMLTQLEETAENIQLVEVEIYNGASEDIIWQNAHPEYRKMAKDLDNDEDRTPASKVWDWGHTQVVNDTDGGEVWEDELGSFKADVIDNCSSKDRYLALRLGKRGPRAEN